MGSIDGKHVEVVAPPNSGSDYINYKDYFSIVLLGLVDANYCFLYANVGCQGRISDGGVFANSSLKKMIDDLQLNIPEKTPLQGRTMDVPYVFIGDDAFPLQVNMMKPFKGEHPKGSLERIYNYRICRPRRVVENTFGILSATFRVLRKPINLHPQKAAKVTLACIDLHNFLKKSKTSRHTYCPPRMLDYENSETGEIIPGQWRNIREGNASLAPLRNVGRRAPEDAYSVRLEFANYFSSPEGRIERQAIVE